MHNSSIQIPKSLESIMIYNFVDSNDKKHYVPLGVANVEINTRVTNAYNFFAPLDIDVDISKTKLQEIIKLCHTIIKTQQYAIDYSPLNDAYHQAKVILSKLHVQHFLKEELNFVPMYDGVENDEKYTAWQKYMLMTLVPYNKYDEIINASDEELAEFTMFLGEYEEPYAESMYSY